MDRKQCIRRPKARGAAWAAHGTSQAFEPGKSYRETYRESYRETQRCWVGPNPSSSGLGRDRVGSRTRCSLSGTGPAGADSWPGGQLAAGQKASAAARSAEKPLAFGTARLGWARPSSPAPTDYPRTSPHGLSADWSPRTIRGLVPKDYPRTSPHGLSAD